MEFFNEYRPAIIVDSRDARICSWTASEGQMPCSIIEDSFEMTSRPE